ncbi:integrase [Bacteroidia bacterium]|nr:integrase [Bacteroidia bacterium]
MLNYSLNGVTVCTVRDIRKKDADEACPVRVRITFQRKQIYYSIGISLTKDEWENLPASKSPKLIEARGSIQAVFDNIKKHVKKMAEDDSFSFESVNLILGKATGDTVNTAFNAKIKALTDNEQIGSAGYYACALNSLEKYKGSAIRFMDVNVEWLNRYEAFMLKNDSSYTTIAMYLRALRTIINDARKCGAIKESHYPFGKDKYVIKEGEGRELVLTMEEIGRIARFSCATPAYEKYRDIWMFSFLCNGANVVDVCKLKYGDMDMINNELSFYRSKTIRTAQRKVKIIAPILPPMAEVIEKWGNPDKDIRNHIFPFLPDDVNPVDEKRMVATLTKHINKYIKKIAAQLELPDISTYWCRHSFVTALMKARVPESYISEAVGHSTKTVTQGYFGRYTKEERLKYNSLLLNY